MDCLYIIIPAYNESENLKKLIEDWYPVVESTNNEYSKLVVIDDGSKDNTYDILKKMATTRPLLLPMAKANSGHGPTLIFGYNYD